MRAKAEQWTRLRPSTPEGMTRAELDRIHALGRLEQAELDKDENESSELTRRNTQESVIPDEEAEAAQRPADDNWERARLRGARSRRPDKEAIAQKRNKLIGESSEARLRRQMYFMEPRAMDLPKEEGAVSDDDDNSDEDDYESGSESDSDRGRRRPPRRSKQECAEDARRDAAASAFGVEEDRKRRLCRTANGDRLWMQARPMRANIAAAVKEKPKAPKPQRWVWLQQLPDKERAEAQRPFNVWFFAPAVAQLPRDRAWCWRGDFVGEARLAAETSGLVMAVVDEEVADRVTCKTGKTLPALQAHVEVTATDGKKQLWSTTFIGLLDMLRSKWRLGDSIRQTERDVLERIERTTGFRANSWSDLSAEAQPDRSEAIRAFKLRQASELLSAKPAPALPRIPRKLGERPVYKAAGAWSQEPWLTGSLPRLGYSASGNLHRLSDAEVARWDQRMSHKRPLRREWSAPTVLSR